MNIMQHIEH